MKNVIFSTGFPRKFSRVEFKKETNTQKLVTDTMAVPLEATSVLSDVVEWSSEEIIFAQDPSDLMKKWETLEVRNSTRERECVIFCSLDRAVC